MPRAPVVRERRRRRTPEEAEAEILDAAERLLKARPLHELTVQAVMAETTLSRNAFYVYFRDRYDLIGKVVGRLRTHLNLTLAQFLDPRSDHETAGREALLSAARMYIEYGPILRSLEQAARTNKSAARAWDSFTRPAYEAILERLKEEIELRGVGDPDPEELVRTLLTMTRASFFELADQKNPDVDRLVDTLQRIWRRALFP